LRSGAYRADALVTRAIDAADDPAATDAELELLLDGENSRGVDDTLAPHERPQHPNAVVEGADPDETRIGPGLLPEALGALDGQGGRLGSQGVLAHEPFERAVHGPAEVRLGTGLGRRSVDVVQLERPGALLVALKAGEAQMVVGEGHGDPPLGQKASASGQGGRNRPLPTISAPAPDARPRSRG